MRNTKFKKIELVCIQSDIEIKNQQFKIKIIVICVLSRKL